ncbi:MAG TPA: lysylphosphatidylglycerol synthase domain-containing protein [Steroidobacteraceae bacterium]|nr:lysylphosphatidylglycerol synthase domain-containing protein [Steroidobacteraceae bacterium]
MKVAAYIAGLLGLALLVALVIHADVPAILHTWRRAGAALLLPVPYRLLFFALYAVGWRALLRPYDAHHRAGFGWVLWVTMVREAIDRLLPVASVGGGVVGVRLMRKRDLQTVPVSATVIVEILLTLIVMYVFGAAATLILFSSGAASNHRDVLIVLALSLPIPLGSLLLLRYGSVFQRLERFLGPMVGLREADGAAALDADLRACLGRLRTLGLAGSLQLVALVSAAFEIWWALRLFGHPVSAPAAVMLEGLTQALRHLAFIVPAGLGVQEGALVLFGHALGISTELALSVSAVKRLREILCGLPPLLWWQWYETRTLGTHARATRGRDHPPRT